MGGTHLWSNEVKLYEMQKMRAETSAKIEAVLAGAAKENRALTHRDQADLVLLRSDLTDIDAKIDETKSRSSLSQMVGEHGPAFMFDGGDPSTASAGAGLSKVFATPALPPMAAKHHTDFAAWAQTAAGSLAPGMQASDPAGTISISTGSGLYSANFATPLEVLPYETSYIQYSPFERAGARVLPTSHMRAVNVPVLSAGAVPDSFGEGQGPTSSKPFGMSGFTMQAHKRSRMVTASWETLMSTEFPLQPMILDELLTAIANAQTQDSTQALYSALTAPPNVTIASGSLPPLQIGGSSVQADVYGQMTALRHSLVDGLERPDNAWMLSRNTLAIIRNTRATNSGVVMFDPESDTILGRPYVTNEYFDAACGAGFVAYGNWNKGAFLRRTPLYTRVLQEVFAQQNEIGFLTSSWTDSHFLAELIGAANPPSHQPLYFTVLPAGALA